MQTMPTTITKYVPLIQLWKQQVEQKQLQKINCLTKECGNSKSEAIAARTFELVHVMQGIVLQYPVAVD